MRRWSKVVLGAMVSGALLLTGGCASLGRKPAPEPERDPVLSELVAVSRVVSDEIRALRMVRQSRYQKNLDGVAGYRSVPPAFMKKVSISWAGRPEPLVARLARQAGYSYSESYKGRVRALPQGVIVSIHAENQSIAQVLRDIGLQLGAKAGLVVNDRTRTVEIVVGDYDAR